MGEKFLFSSQALSKTGLYKKKKNHTDWITDALWNRTAGSEPRFSLEALKTRFPKLSQ